MEASHDRIKLINELTSYVLSDSGLEEQSNLIVKKVSAIFNCDAAVIRIIQNEELVVLASHGINKNNLLPSLPANEGLASKVIQSKKPFKVFDVNSDPVTVRLVNKRPNELKFVSYAGAPLVVNNKVIGILGIFIMNEKREFTEFELDELQLVANQVAIRIENLRLFEGIKQQNEKLKEEIANRILTEEKLLQAKKDAEKSDRLKSEFLAQMSHEIRTPVNTIMSFISLLKDELKDVENEMTSMCFESISASSRRLIRTVDLIINMSEIQIDSYECNFKKVRLVENILQNIVAEYIPIIELKGLTFNFNNQLEDKEVEIFADEYTLSKVFENLIDNAVKFTFSGKVEISLINKNNLIEVTISDTGIGISEEYLPQLFTPFSQEEQGYTRKFDGTGLGLALVFKYCQMNNVAVNVNSRKGIGSSFTISINTNHHSNNA